MEHIDATLNDADYIDRHKLKPTAFTRVRKLTFITIFILILRSSVKSIQLVLNELVVDTGMNFSITAGAFCRARKKLSHTAYVELNTDIIGIYYKDNDIKRFKSYRLLAFDAAKITLPNTKEIKKEFGSKSIRNHTFKNFGEHVSAAYEACYDVLNNIAVRSSLNPGNVYEVDLANKMLVGLNPDDLLIFDRGYASYLFMASLINQEKQFIIRCPRSFFSADQNMFAADAPETMTVQIDLSAHHQKKAKELELLLTIKIRLIKIILSTGEVEVLATNLLDQSEFSNDEFKYLYGLRWEVETFFSKIKGRLNVENFTGKTLESVKQDFWSTIFISNLEAIITEKTEEKMNLEKTDENKKVKINKAVSFNAIKKMAFDIFFNEKNKSLVLEKLDSLFRMNPVVVRGNREVLRKKVTDTKSLNFQRYKRKHVF